ncbi:MAG: class I SAM-dependent methyltransferase, partial [Anaerolineales bacterium]|nr:class I SAM-dependent methyltransferase [Anaerolineales bacterium]
HRLQVPIDQSWFVNRLNAAARLRAPLLNLPSKKATTGYRLVHGENDGFPGLVIDRYEETLVIKLYTLAWIPHLVDVIAALNQVVPGDRLLLRFSRALLDQANMLYSLHDGLTLFGSALDRPVLFSENGLRFEADLQHGNKTGFFFDQRDNRAQVERLAAGKRVLDVFAYSGGFSVYAARGGAQEITSIDISRAALNAALRNIQHNRAIPEVASAQHTVTAGDAFEILSQMGANGQRFDLVIIDPPAFAQKQSQISKAISAYQRLTRLGLRVLQPGGILVQASCSSRVTANEFFNSINRAAQLAGRPLNELARSGHPLDHPIRFEQGAYLKCLFAKA